MSCFICLGHYYVIITLILGVLFTDSNFQQGKSFYFQISGQSMIIYNKMFKQKSDNDEKFLKMKKTTDASIFFHSCRSQQSFQLQQIHCCGHQPKIPKISIKKLLNRNNNGSQSCSILSETVKSVLKCSDQSSLIKLSTYPHLAIIEKQTILQKEEEKSFFRGQVSNEAKNNPLHYDNLAPSIQNINKIVEKKIMESLPTKKNDIEKGLMKNYTQQPVKKEIFNQFVSFGPKNLKKFKQFSQKEFNQCLREDIIVQATQRTDQLSPEIPEKAGKRLSKTFSEFDIQKQLRKHTSPDIIRGRYFKEERQEQRSMLLKIKHAQTMKNDFSSASDHESQVVENYESLIEQVKHNRLSNWSYESQFMDI